MTFVRLHKVHFLDIIFKGLKGDLQVQNSSCLLVSSSVSWLAAQDTQVKCFLSVPTCRDNTALCQQTRSPPPPLHGGEPSTAVSVSDCDKCMLRDTKDRAAATRADSSLSWIFIYNWPQHVFIPLDMHFCHFPLYYACGN